MLRTRPLLRFILVFTLIYALALVAGTLGDKVYADRFRSSCRVLFYSLIDKGAVGFVAIKKPLKPRFTTEIRLANMKVMNESLDRNKPYNDVRLEISSWYIGYLPTALLVALLCAIPGLAWKTRVLALVAGALVIHLFIFMKLYIQLLYEFERNEWLQVAHFTPFCQRVMDNLHYLFVTSMGLNFMVPVLICISVLLLSKNHLAGQPSKQTGNF